MSKFLVTYHGDTSMPDSPEGQKQVHDAFQSWAASVGAALLDPGAPLIGSKTVTQRGVTQAPADGPAGGYTLLEADDMDGAVKLVKNHPFVGRGGSLQVSEAANLGG